MTPARTTLALILAVACCAPAAAVAAGTFVLGTPRPDRIAAGSGADVVFGQGGADTILGGAGAHRIDGDGACPAAGARAAESTNAAPRAGAAPPPRRARDDRRP